MIDFIQNKPIQERSYALTNFFKRVILGEGIKKIRFKVWNDDCELPVYHLPYGKVYIGFNPPKPHQVL